MMEYTKNSLTMRCVKVVNEKMLEFKNIVVPIKLPAAASFLSRFFHHKICKSNSLPFYLLFLYNLIVSFFKKRFCCNGSMGCDGARNRLLQPIADSGRNAFSLMVGMNKQTVKVSGAVYIAKADKNILFNSDDGVMILKRLVPFIQIHLSGCPYM